PAGGLCLAVMSEVTRILGAIEGGDPSAAEQLLPLVYAELRRLAAAQLAREKPGQTLEATALVHEAYLRLVGGAQPGEWGGRALFRGAGAGGGRRRRGGRARRRGRARHGGGRRRVELGEALALAEGRPDDLLALDEALGRLEAADPEAARLVKLRFFA